MRNAYWADFVPLGFFATWACEPNTPIEDIEKLLEGFRDPDGNYTVPQKGVEE